MYANCFKHVGEHNTSRLTYKGQLYNDGRSVQRYSFLKSGWAASCHIWNVINLY